MAHRAVPIYSIPTTFVDGIELCKIADAAKPVGLLCFVQSHDQETTFMAMRKVTNNVEQIVILTLFCTLLVAPGPAIAEVTEQQSLNTQSSALVNKYDQRDDSWRGWRIPDWDAVNSLYLLARQCGNESTLGQVRSAFGKDLGRISVLDIRNAGKLIGLQLSIRRTTPDSLVSLKAPAIIRLEGNTTSEGRIVVVLPGLENADPIVIDGYSTQLASQRPDLLWRRWDGVVLVPEQGKTSRFSFLAAYSFLLLAAFRIWFWNALAFRSVLQRRPDRLQ